MLHARRRLLPLLALAPVLLPPLLRLRQVPQEPPLAVVDGEPIDAREYGAYLIETVGLRPLRGLVLRKLVAKEAAALGLSADEDAVRAEFEETWRALEQRWSGDAELIERELTTQGFDVARYRRLVEGNARHAQLADAVCRAGREVTPDAVRAAFADRYGPGGRRETVRHVFLDERRVAEELRAAGEEPSPARVHAELERRVDALRARLAEGADFAELARESSHDARTKDHGGVLTAESVRELGDTFVQAVRSSAVGLPAGPVFSTRGAHLIEVTAREVTPFDDVRAALERELRDAPATRAEIAALEQRLFDAAEIRGL